MNVEILTADKTLFSGDADVLTLPGVNGSFQILNGHAPMIANLAQGKLSIKANSTAETFDVNGGLVEVLKDKVVVLV
jgi:F-type H+-transporting ATPase subunit epsilon